jgi:3-oxoacyl-[acyl-carrier protein] reductase
LRRAAVGTLSAYAAKKGAIDTLVKHFTSVLGANGVRVDRSHTRVVQTNMSNFASGDARWISGDTIQVDGGSKLSSRRYAGMSPRINGKRDLNHGNEPA